MTVNRTPRERPRKPLIDDETLALFVKLESQGRRDLRSDRAFSDQDRELHRRLGLGAEWFCSVVSVLDRATEHYRPDSIQGEDFRRVRAVRLQLLEEARRRGYEIAAEPPPTARKRAATTIKPKRVGETRARLN